MSDKLGNKKKHKFTDDDIDRYCQSVEALLTSINDRSSVKRRKKVVKTEEVHSSFVDNDLMSRLN
jgi:hypothetical protein